MHIRSKSHTRMKSKNSMTLTLYMTRYTFICTLLFGLLELSKIILFKGLVEKIIEAKMDLIIIM